MGHLPKEALELRRRPERPRACCRPCGHERVKPVFHYDEKGSGQTVEVTHVDHPDGCLGQTVSTTAAGRAYAAADELRAVGRRRRHPATLTVNGC